MLHHVRYVRKLTQLDLCGAYNLIRIDEGDEYKPSFRMCYSKFEFRVIPFGLTIAPATFQSYIEDCLQPYIHYFAVCYLDNMLIYSTNEKEHEEHVRQALQRLKEFGLSHKAEKC